MPPHRSTNSSSVPFEKWDATGNDFLLIDLEITGLTRAQFTADVVRNLCCRQSGPGADGVFLFYPDIDEEGPITQAEIINSDGSLAAMCGNALRCLAQALREKTGRPQHRVQLGGRTIDVSAIDESNSSVNLGRPDHLEGYTLFQNVPPFEALLGHPGHLLSFGNPHYVVPVETIPENWVDLGAQLQSLADSVLGTGGINCGFLGLSSLDSEDPHFSLKIFERGAGPTLSCGSGTCAASAVLQHILNREPPHDFQTPGGRLTVGRQEDDYLLLGPAHRIQVGA